MKKVYQILMVAIIFCLICGGCGRESDGQVGNAQNGKDIVEDNSGHDANEHLTITVEKEELPTPSEEDGNWTRFAMQFWNDEVIQIWGREQENENGEKIRNVYIYREDGSGEILLENVEKKYYNKCFLCADGKVLLFSSSGLIGLDEEGKECYRWTDGIVTDICQLTNGRIIMLIRENAGGKRLRMAELFPDTGSVDIMENIALDSEAMQYIGTGEQGVMLMDQTGFWEVNLETSSMVCTLSLESSTYQLGVVFDFRVQEDGTVEVLQNGKIETLQLTNVMAEKTIITYRGCAKSSGIERAINLFNDTNEKYYVVMEIMGDDEELQDYRNQTAMEIVAGGGADIINQYAIGDVYSLIEKGVLADLRPLMEGSGIYEEDYFPAAFAYRDEESIYSVSPSIYLGDSELDASILENGNMPDVETLLDALLAYREKVVFRENWDSGEVLEYFLSGTETFFGMVDWENGTCNFSVELFAKLLKVAKQYGWEAQNIYPALVESASVNDMYEWASNAELKGKGKVRLGYWFDNGCQAQIYTNDCWVLNSNSPNKEGAWEFIYFLINEQAQKELEEGAIGQEYYEDLGTMQKVYKAGKDKMYELGWSNEETYHELYDLTETDIAELRERLENARVFPRKTEPLIAIISEEAGAYFSGVKSIEEVVGVIESRVQLYLDENQ